jgi:multiple sugar transport system ATP-binding protein
MFVAGFIGSPAMNMIEVPVTGNSVSFAGASVAITGSPSRVIVGVRPEGLEVSGDGVAAVVEFVEELGSDSFIHCSLDTPNNERVVARAPGLSRIASHSRVTLRARQGSLHAFDGDSGLRISA